MELWIRSQNKELLVLAKGFEFQKLYDGKFQIFAVWQNNYQMVGIYKSKERALEVLDEIQNILKPKYILNSSSIRPDGDSWVENGIIMQKYNANARIEEIPIYVYEMPKEWEIKNRQEIFKRNIDKRGNIVVELRCKEEVH